MKKLIVLLLVLTASAWAQFGHTSGLNSTQVGTAIADSITAANIDSVAKKNIADSSKWTAEGGTPDSVYTRGAKAVKVPGLLVTGASKFEGAVTVRNNLTMAATVSPKLTTDSTVALTGIRSEGGARIKGAAQFGVTTTPMIIEADGDVGIGTSAPAADLDVYSTARFGNGTTPVRITQGGRISTSTTAGDTTAKVFIRPITDIPSLNVTDENGTSKLYINKDGSVGIATTVPDVALDVNGAMKASWQVYAGGGYGFMFDGNSNDTGLQGSASSDYVTMQTAGTERVRLTNTGLGIGLTAPSGALHIVSGGAFKVGAAQWDVAASDSINGASIAARTISALAMPALAGDVTGTYDVTVVGNDSHDHTTTISGKAANVSDADFGDVTVSTGAWGVEDDSHNHTTASTKFVVADSFRTEKTAIIRGASKFGLEATPTYITTGGEVGVGTTVDNTKMTIGLNVNQGANDDEALALRSSDIAHGMTTEAETDVYFNITKYSGTIGGAKVQGFGDTGGVPALILIGSQAAAQANVPAIRAIFGKKSGTANYGLAATDLGFQFANGYNSSTVLWTMLGNGSIGHGVVYPGAKMEINGSKLADSLLIVRNDIVGRDSMFAVTSDGSTMTTGTATVGETGADDPIIISPNAKGSTAYTGTITTTGDLSGNRQWELTDYNGIHWVTGTRFNRPHLIVETDWTAINNNDGATNYIVGSSLGPITYREEQAKTTRSWTETVTGLNIDADNTINDEGVEIYLADGVGATLGDGWIVTGTTGGKFEVTFTITDVSATDQLLVGWRSCVAFDDANAYANYVEHILLGITATDGSVTASSRVPAIAGGAQQTDDSTVDLTDGTQHVLRVDINASTRIPTAYLDGVAVTLTNCGGARTTATAMAPFITYMHGAEAADPGITINRISIWR